MEYKIIIGIDASRANRAEKTGVEWYAFNLIQEFKKLIPSEYRVMLYSAEPLMGELAVLPPNWESKIIKGINFGCGPWLWTQLGLTLEMIKNKPDILFVPSHAIPFIHPKHTFTTIHDIGFEVFPESYSFLARLYHRFSARLALYAAEKIFTPSEFTKEEIVKRYRADPEKIIITPLGFDAGRYNPHPADKTGREPYVLFVGSVEKKKNVKRLIEAFRLLKSEVSIPHKLMILGMPGYGFEEIKEAAGDSKDIIFTGYVPVADMPVILANASLCALPSLYEGFGIPVLESFASGVPVLTSNTSSLPEVAGDAAVLINPESVEEIKGGLKKLILDDNYRSLLIEKGLARAKDFSWEKTAKKTLSAIL